MFIVKAECKPFIPRGGRAKDEVRAGKPAIGVILK